MSFENDLRALINKHSREKQSDTPDYVLSFFILKCLNAFEKATEDRDRHRGEFK